MKFMIMLILLTSISCTSQPTKNEPIDVTLCEVRDHPNIYNGMLIRFKATILSDALEGTALFDKSCRSRSVGVDIRNGDADWSAVNDIVFSKRYLNSNKKVLTAYFVGIFHHEKKSNYVSVMSISNIDLSDGRNSSIKIKAGSD